MAKGQQATFSRISEHHDHRVDEAVATGTGPDEKARLERAVALDDAVGRLARKLQRMTREVQAREMSLQREIAQLRAEIVEGRRA